MTRLFIEPEAEEELDEAAARYEDAVPGLGTARILVFLAAFAGCAGAPPPASAKPLSAQPEPVDAAVMADSARSARIAFEVSQGRELVNHPPRQWGPGGFAQTMSVGSCVLGGVGDAGCVLRKVSESSYRLHERDGGYAMLDTSDGGCALPKRTPELDKPPPECGAQPGPGRCWCRRASQWEVAVRKCDPNVVEAALIVLNPCSLLICEC
jgi:hypothetical protein